MFSISSESVCQWLIFRVKGDIMTNSESFNNFKFLFNLHTCKQLASQFLFSETEKYQNVIDNYKVYNIFRMIKCNTNKNIV